MASYDEYKPLSDADLDLSADDAHLAQYHIARRRIRSLRWIVIFESVLLALLSITVLAMLRRPSKSTYTRPYCELPFIVICSSASYPH